MRVLGSVVYGSTNRKYTLSCHENIVCPTTLNVMHFGIRTDRNMVYTDRYNASMLDNPPVAGGGGALKGSVGRAVPPEP